MRKKFRTLIEVVGTIWNFKFLITFEPAMPSIFVSLQLLSQLIVENFVSLTVLHELLVQYFKKWAFDKKKTLGKKKLYKILTYFVTHIKMVKIEKKFNLFIYCSIIQSFNDKGGSYFFPFLIKWTKYWNHLHYTPRGVKRILLDRSLFSRYFRIFIRIVSKFAKQNAKTQTEAAGFDR